MGLLEGSGLILLIDDPEAGANDRSVPDGQGRQRQSALMDCGPRLRAVSGGSPAATRRRALRRQWRGKPKIVGPRSAAARPACVLAGMTSVNQ
jgi:hypothetical protein